MGSDSNKLQISDNFGELGTEALKEEIKNLAECLMDELLEINKAKDDERKDHNPMRPIQSRFDRTAS
jgi:hypothetical protein